MSEAVEGITLAGKKVFTFAPSAIASRKVLRDEGFLEANTVARLLIDEKLQRRLKNQVVWIDEAGLLSVRDMLAIFRLAERENARVVLSGDSRQHSAVERGDALRTLEVAGAVSAAEVNEIRRQKGDYKRAIEALSLGETGRAFGMLDRLGCVREISAEDIADKISDDYLRAVQKGKSTLVISPTHKQGDAVAAAIRRRLKAAKLLGKKEWQVYQQTNLNWTDAEKSDARAYQIGDVVQFVQNGKGFARGERIVITGRDEAGRLTCSSLAGAAPKTVFEPGNVKRFQVYRQGALDLAAGERLRVTQGGFTKKRNRLENGAVYTVKAFGPEGIECNNGYKIPWDYGHLAYGYVSTSHAAQGRTVDEVIIAQSGESLIASSREQFYVSASRGRERLAVYTDDRNALLEAVGASGNRISATELLTEKSQNMGLFEKLGIKKPKMPAASAEKPVAGQPSVKHEDKVLGGSPKVVLPDGTTLGGQKEKVTVPVGWDVKKAQIEHDKREGHDVWGAKLDKLRKDDPAWKAKEAKPGSAFQTREKKVGAVVPAATAKASGFAGVVPATVDKTWQQKEVERKANKTDEDFKARGRILDQEAERSKAIQGQKQAREALHKRHGATQINQAAKVNAVSPVVKGKWTGQIAEERQKAAAKPAPRNLPSAITPPRSVPPKAVPPKPVPPRIPPPVSRGPRR